jgi:hypothetical protein
MGSYVALVGANNPKLGEKFAALGLRAHPRDAGLQNNLVVALLEQGNLNAAEEIRRTIQRPDADQETEITLTATDGLIAFRRGDVHLGRALYSEAIGAATDAGLERIAIVAELHMIRELMRTDTPDMPAALATVIAKYAKHADADIQELLGRLAHTT